MAEENKRIINYTDDTAITDGDYVLVDNETEGTKKFNLGKELTDIKEDLENKDGVSDALKQALLQIAENVVYEDDNAQTYYEALYNALYPAATLSYITATYTQQGIVYDNDDLGSLKDNLVVTAYMSDQTSYTVVNYTLSGTLEAGNSEITVSYMNKTTSFTVEVTHNPLPTGYTRYDYVKNNNVQDNTVMINTALGGEYCGDNYEHEIEYALITKNGSQSSAVYGKRNGTGSTPGSRSMWQTNGPSLNVVACDTSIATLIPNSAGVKLKIRVSGNKVYLNDELYETLSNDTNTAINASYTTYGIGLFGVVTQNNISYVVDYMKIYSFKVKDIANNTYVADMIPCTDPDGVAGFYDTVRLNFYHAITSSKLTAEND